MTEESRTDFSSNQSRKPFFSPAYATKQGAIYRNFPSVSFPNSFPRVRARPRPPQKTHHPTLNPLFNKISRFTTRQNPTDTTNEILPPILVRALDRANDPIHRSGRVGSRRSSTVDDVERVASPPYVIPRLTIRPYRPAHPRRSVTDRARSMPMQVVRPPILPPLGVPTPTPRIRRVTRARLLQTHLARRLLGGNLSGTTARGVRGGDDDSGGAHGKHFVFAGSFVRTVTTTGSVRFGSARLGSARARSVRPSSRRRSATLPRCPRHLLGNPVGVILYMYGILMHLNIVIVGYVFRINPHRSERMRPSRTERAPPLARRVTPLSRAKQASMVRTRSDA